MCGIRNEKGEGCWESAEYEEKKKTMDGKNVGIEGRVDMKAYPCKKKKKKEYLIA